MDYSYNDDLQYQQGDIKQEHKSPHCHVVSATSSASTGSFVGSSTFLTSSSSSLVPPVAASFAAPISNATATSAFRPLGAAQPNSVRPRRYRCVWKDPDTGVQCTSAFVCPAQLKTHNCFHTGEKPFPCEYCSKRYTQRSDLNKHVDSAHHKKRLWMCNWNNGGSAGSKPCGIRYSLRHSLVRHVRAVHLCLPRKNGASDTTLPEEDVRPYMIKLAE